MATTTSFSLEKLGTSIISRPDGQFAYAKNPVMIGLKNGGFVTAVDDFGASHAQVIFEFSNAAGLATSRSLIGFSDPSMTLLSDDLVAAVGTGWDGNLFVRKVDQGGSSLLRELGPGRNADIAADSYRTGYAVAYESPADSGYSLITLFIDRSNHGTDAFSFSLSNVSGGPVIDRNPSVARLASGNYVVAWDRTDAYGDSAIWYGIYDTNGSVVAAPREYDVIGAHNSKPSVAAYGAGFTITYEDSESGRDIAVFTQSPDVRTATYNRYEPPGNGPASDPDTTRVGGLAVTALDIGILNVSDVVANDIYLGPSNPETGARLTDTDNLMLVAANAGQASVTALAGNAGRLIISYYDELGGNVHQQLARLRETVTGMRRTRR